MLLACGGDPAAECRKIRVGDSVSKYSDHVEAEAHLSRTYEAPKGATTQGQFQTGPAGQDYCCDARITDGGAADNAQCMGISCDGVGAVHSVNHLTAPYSYSVPDQNSPDPFIFYCMVGVRDGSVSSVWLRYYQD